jgi:hypothetical protein
MANVMLLQVMSCWYAWTQAPLPPPFIMLNFRAPVECTGSSPSSRANFDVTIVHPHSSSFVDQAARTKGSTAAFQDRQKYHAPTQAMHMQVKRQDTTVLVVWAHLGEKRHSTGLVRLSDSRQGE